MTTFRFLIRLQGCGLIMLLAAMPYAGNASEAVTAEQARMQLERSGTEVSIERLVQHAAQGDTSTVELLLAAGISASAVEPKRQVSPLHGAAAQGHLRIATRFLDLGAPVDAQDWHGATPLVHAAYYDKSDIVRLLLARGAEVNHVPSAAPTALASAVQTGDIELIRLLLSAGADPKLKDYSGTTPIVAAERAHRDAIVTLLRDEKSGDKS